MTTDDNADRSSKKDAGLTVLISPPGNNFMNDRFRDGGGQTVSKGIYNALGVYDFVWRQKADKKCLMTDDRSCEGLDD